MCTVTWWYGDDGYDVFFNRDELKTRLPEITPKKQIMDGVRFIAPTDVDAGGTWLFVNEHGLTLGVLNQYPKGARRPQSPKVSRGLLVRSLANCESVAEAQARLAATDLSHSMPFMLFAVSLSESCVMAWDTHGLRTVEYAEERMPLTSSSYKTEQVELARKHLFLDALMEDDVTYGPEFLQAFHHTACAGDDGAYGVCMERDDARTVSYSRIRIRHGRAAMFDYRRRSPVGDGFEDTISMELKLSQPLVPEVTLHG